ncbi:hypothetical protein [Dongia rigui]|uniref:Uncharacterized protein n=1 Tax=Dongia rigui TaxID=940149 RepID=A0ABU5E0E2_9PROT|nr:hypothetical protein [Dongia rigui]MDY0872358.1 hypothetical protein [Dongia rigui]
MIRIVLATLLLAAQTTYAVAETGRLKINNIPLDMPLNEELDGEYLEGIYQEKLNDRLITSVLNEWPIYHIDSTLKVGKGKVTKKDSVAGADTDPKNEQMQLYFSSAADQRRIFWIRTRKPMNAPADADGTAKSLAMIESSFGKPDRVITDAEMPGDAIVIIVDPQLPADQAQAIKAALPDPMTLSHDDYMSFWSMDLQARAKILGPNFRGAIVLLVAFKERLELMQTELLDLKRAQTVLNLN